MFFGSAARKELDEVKNELAQCRESEGALRARVAELEAQLSMQGGALADSAAQLAARQDIAQRLGQFAVTLESSQQSVSHMADQLKAGIAQIDEARNMSATSGGAMIRLVADIGSLSARSEAASGSVAALGERTSKIAGIVNLIKEIADQTNLLALNAAIEAARAGEQGRGFAVVADEVRKLAERTTKATAEISTLVSQIEADTGSATASMGSLADEARRFASEGDSATSDMQRLLDLTSRMERTLAASALRSFVELAKMDHLAYKFSIYQAFFGLNGLTARDVSDHTACRLGRWYYDGDGARYCSRLPGFRDVDAPHAAVHRHGREALEALGASNPAAGVEALGLMEAASVMVFDALERIAGEGEADPGLLQAST